MQSAALAILGRSKLPQHWEEASEHLMEWASEIGNCQVESEESMGQFSIVERGREPRNRSQHLRRCDGVGRESLVACL